MQGCCRPFQIDRLVRLTISRGPTHCLERLLVEISHEGTTGLGETGHVDTGHHRYTSQAVAAELAQLWPQLEPYAPDQWQQCEPLLEALSPPARCGVDLALRDWWGKALGHPLWRLWGLDRQRCGATSVTIGLGSVAAVRQRLRQWFDQVRPSRIKLKLGSPQGLDHDRQLVQTTVRELERWPRPVDVQIDVNGGWNLDQAMTMAPWLADQGAVLLEQPLAAASDDHEGYAALRPHCPLPLVVDESCWTLQDLIRLAPHVDGVNLKLLKHGGLGPTLLLARVAQLLGLRLMLGCYADTSLLNGAAAQLLPLVQWPDLDSHLNLRHDPFLGLERSQDVIRPSTAPGLGIQLAKPLQC
ncbi:MAG: L-alanine-DL-glutamate epimerase [Candidatus Synechococcus spongiarum SP3]|uniref:Dipeptide epimerase n=1 Tax=Candidatus Synechococcus spongiarum SP3 TaxID=1604020 RepID=A0A0G2IWS9_9SYNE|nr:MAG: L-alanine-DL-glutamate epimerase [Candidatus Synechococcus spongiarum SP3]